jgi:uncharacterized protein
MRKWEILRAALVGVVCLWVLLVASTYAFQDVLLYPFDDHGTFTKPPKGFAALVVENGRFVPPHEGDVEGVVRVWRAAPEGEVRGRILVLVGGRGTPRTALSRAAPFVAADWEVVVAVYPGTVGTPGQPSQEGLLRVARTVLGAFETPPLVYGYSMGGALAVLVAAEVPVGGLFLEAPLADVWPLVRSSAPWVAPFPFVWSDRWDALELAPSVKAPAWVVHGDGDGVVPVEQGRALAAALGAGLHEVVGGGHKDLPKRGLIEGLDHVAKAGQGGWLDAARSAFPVEGTVADP